MIEFGDAENLQMGGRLWIAAKKEVLKVLLCLINEAEPQ